MSTVHKFSLPGQSLSSVEILPIVNAIIHEKDFIVQQNFETYLDFAILTHDMKASTKYTKGNYKKLHAFR
jgi:hypothetical protein